LANNDAFVPIVKWPQSGISGGRDRAGVDIACVRYDQRFGRFASATAYLPEQAVYSPAEFFFVARVELPGDSGLPDQGHIVIVVPNTNV
jgi:hypothetical protein